MLRLVHVLFLTQHFIEQLQHINSMHLKLTKQQDTAQRTTDLESPRPLSSILKPLCLGHGHCAVQITNAGKALHARNQCIRWHHQPELKRTHRTWSSSLSEVDEQHAALDSSADAAQQAHSRDKHFEMCTVHPHMQTTLQSSEVFHLPQPE